MADLPFPLIGTQADRLRAALDVEGKLIRALDAIGSLAGRDVAVLDLPPGRLFDQLAEAGIRPLSSPLTAPLHLGLPDESVDAVVSLWSGFRGVDWGDIAEVDRVLRPGGRLLVVHDYGRDDVSTLLARAEPGYGLWSRRDGPFLNGGGFRIRVIHCFWTFASLEDARGFLGDAFGDLGDAVAGRLKRPRLSWNVAVYHRPRGGADVASDTVPAPALPLGRRSRRATDGGPRASGPPSGSA